MATAAGAATPSIGQPPRLPPAHPSVKWKASKNHSIPIFDSFEYKTGDCGVMDENNAKYNLLAVGVLKNICIILFGKMEVTPECSVHL